MNEEFTGVPFKVTIEWSGFIFITLLISSSYFECTLFFYSCHYLYVCVYGLMVLKMFKCILLLICKSFILMAFIFSHMFMVEVIVLLLEVRLVKGFGWADVNVINSIRFCLPCKNLYFPFIFPWV